MNDRLWRAFDCPVEEEATEYHDVWGKPEKAGSHVLIEFTTLVFLRLSGSGSHWTSREGVVNEQY